MKLIFETSYLAWFIPLCLLGGIGLSLLLYYKSNFAREKGIFSYPVIILFFLRFLSISLILFFLLSPLLKKVNERKEKPIIVFAIDNSRSILLNKDSNFYKNDFTSQINSFPKNISKRFEVKTILFGSKVTTAKTADFSFNRTNFGSLIDYISQEYYNRNLGAVVIASDGIYNEGKDPVPMMADLKVPVYTVALGDTTLRKDLMIREVLTNSIAYLGNSFPVRINIRAVKCANSKVQLKIIHENKIEGTENIDIQGNYFDKTVDIKLDANKAGLQGYQIMLTHLPNEINYRNNSKMFFVDVLENKKSVLLIAASPHPDVSAIKNSLTIHDNYLTKTMLAFELPRTKPEIEKLLSKFDVVLLHQLPSRNYPVKELLDAIENKKVPVFFVVGSQSSIVQFNSLETGLKIVQSRDIMNTVLPVIDNTFNYFNVPENISELMAELPPLTVPFGDYRLSQEAQVLMKQKIGQLNTEMPLIAYINGLNSRTIVLCGEGIWKWPLIEYKLKGNQLVFDELINKSFQFLFLKNDRRLFRFVSLRSQFYDDEHVIFNAEVLNQNLEMLKGAKVKMFVSDQNNKRKEFLFQETQEGYNLDIGYFPTGNYRYQASAMINGTEHKLSGEFSVSAVDLEYMNTVADHNLMYKIAHEREGKMYYPNQLKELINELNRNNNIKPMTFFESSIRELIELKWLFFVILIFLSAEWFLRKFYGSY